MNSQSIASGRVLIVDDSPKNIQVVANILRKEGVEMSYALDGQSALSLIESDTFDLILMDIMMPELNGYEVCEKLKRRPDAKDIPVIFLTAKTDTDSIVKGFEAGGVDYITKPFNSMELLARVKTHLILKQTRASLEHTNRKLEYANQQLKKLNDTKDKFFSIIAHDLRNPFQVLIGSSDLLIAQIDILDKNKIRGFLEKIRKSCNQALELLENLLNWSRSQTGSIKRRARNMNLNAIMTANIGLVIENAHLKQITLTNDLPDGLSAHADPWMINTVIRNLLTNAVKFTETGGEIRISATESGDMVEIAVHDTGVGIEDDDISKLFRIDMKHTTPGTANERGSGLGLNVCKEFVEKNGGRIRVESDPGNGSVFYFSIPRTQPEETENADIHGGS